MACCVSQVMALFTSENLQNFHMEKEEGGSFGRFFNRLVTVHFTTEEEHFSSDFLDERKLELARKYFRENYVNI